jgi:ribose/xylose/arabinose/galactoside ABC-type transport system permease subunit
MLAAALVLVALVLFLKKTRYGMIIRAGVENRAMVTALGIDVRRSFTLVFAIGARPASAESSPCTTRRSCRHTWARRCSSSRSS